MSKKMVILGNSDDCRDIVGDFCDEDYCDVAKVTDSDDRGFYIVWSYSEKVSNGCWCIGFAPLDEDEPIPEWARDIKMSLADNGYSIQYELFVPDDVLVEWGDGED